MDLSTNYIATWGRGMKGEMEGVKRLNYRKLGRKFIDPVFRQQIVIHCKYGSQ